MENCSYTVEIEPSLNLACFRLVGRFEQADVEGLAAKRDRAFSRLTSPPNRHVVLVDIRQMTIQPLGGFVAFADLLEREPRALRLAFLVRSNFASMQAQLAAHARGARYFFDEVQARDWLLAHNEPPTSLPLNRRV